MGSFSHDLRRFRSNTEKKLDMIVRKIVFDVYRRIVKRSPVDTGRFRANNQISLNSLPPDSVFQFGKNRGAILRKGQDVLKAFELGDTVFIYNNVVYALALEYGHSQQAPEGIYRISVQELMAHIGAVAGSVK